MRRIIGVVLLLLSQVSTTMGASGTVIGEDWNSLGHWTTTGGNWSSRNGGLVQSHPTGVAAAFLQEPTLTDADVEVRFRVEPSGSGVCTAGIVLRSIDSKRGYFVHFDTRGRQVILMRGDPLSPFFDELKRVSNVRLESGKWHIVRANVTGQDLSVFVDGKLVIEATDDRYSAGRVGLYTSQGEVEFSLLKVKGASGDLEKPWRILPDRPQVDTNQPLALIHETRVLCKQEGRYIGWPCIAQASNGDLLAVFSGDRDGHVSDDGKEQMIRSRDQGKTWGDPVTVFDFPVDDRDAGIVRTRTGAILVTWFTGPPYHTDLQGHYLVRSTDDGHTWSDPIRTDVTTPHGPIQVSDGRLVYIGQRPHCSHTQPANFNGPPAESPMFVSVIESSDDGLSWNHLTDFPVPADASMLSFDEAHMVETATGDLLAQFRDCNAPNQLWQSRSRDGGRGWSTPQRTPIVGYPPHLSKLSNDWLLTTYAKRHSPYGEYACISRDDGKTWDVEHEVYLSAGPNGDLGYPATVQIEDGSLWTVYYQVDKPGEPPCLMGTHWSLKEL